MGNSSRIFLTCTLCLNLASKFATFQYRTTLLFSSIRMYCIRLFVNKYWFVPPFVNECTDLDHSASILSTSWLYFTDPFSKQQYKVSKIKVYNIKLRWQQSSDCKLITVQHTSDSMIRLYNELNVMKKLHFDEKVIWW